MFKDFIKDNNWYIQLLFVEYLKSGFNIAFKFVLVNRNIIFGEIVAEKNRPFEAVGGKLREVSVGNLID